MDQLLKLIESLECDALEYDVEKRTNNCGVAGNLVKGVESLIRIGC